MAERKAQKQWRKCGQAPGKLRGGLPRFYSAAQTQVMDMPVPAVPLSQPRRKVVTATARPVGSFHFCGKWATCTPSLPGQGSSGWLKMVYPFQVDCVVGVDVKHGVRKCGVVETVQ